MSGTEMETTTTLLLQQIERNTRSDGFSIEMGVLTALAASVTFVISLALNDALKTSFAKLNPAADPKGLVGVWSYAAVAVIAGVLLLWALFAIQHRNDPREDAG